VRALVSLLSAAYDANWKVGTAIECSCQVPTDFRQLVDEYYKALSRDPGN